MLAKYAILQLADLNIAKSPRNGAREYFFSSWVILTRIICLNFFAIIVHRYVCRENEPQIVHLTLTFLSTWQVRTGSSNDQKAGQKMFCSTF